MWQRDAGGDELCVLYPMVPVLGDARLAHVTGPERRAGRAVARSAVAEADLWLVERICGVRYVVDECGREDSETVAAAEVANLHSGLFDGHDRLIPLGEGIGLQVVELLFDTRRPSNRCTADSRRVAESEMETR